MILFYGYILFLFILVVYGVSQRKEGNRIWQSYGESLEAFVINQGNHAKLVYSGESWRGLYGEFKGRQISVDSIPQQRGIPFRTRLSMGVEMPASFSFTLKPFSNWQAVYPRLDDPTFDNLFHHKSDPQEVFGQLLLENPLLADKWVSSVVLFLGDGVNNQLSISGKAGQIIVEHGLMPYTEAGLTAMFNSMAHLADAVETLV